MKDRMQKCENCKFFNPAGCFCLRYPPRKSEGGYSSQPGTTSNQWCGEWQPKGDSNAGVYADWLEEHNQKEAADLLRQFDKQ